MKAVVLAAGEGARMGPFTTSEPKVMIPVGNRPILEYVVQSLVDNAIHDIVLVVGYHRERIMSHFEDGRAFGARMEYVTQEKQLGTAHALFAARDTLQGTFLVVNGSNVIDARAVADLLRDDEGPAVLVAESDVPEKYGVVRLQDGYVEGIVEKPTERIGNLINTGVYRFDAEMLADLEPLVKEGRYDIPSLLTEVAGKRKVRAVHTQGVWIDALYPWDLLKVNAAALATVAEGKAGTIESGVTIRGPVGIGEGSHLRSGTYVQGPAVIGRGCEIGPHVVVLPSTSIGDNVRIQPFALVENSIVMDDCAIGAGSTVAHGVLGRGVRVGPNFAAPSGAAEVAIEGERHRVDPVGTFVGEDTVVGSGVAVEPGTIVGARCRIGDLARLRGAIPGGGIVI
jgi:glucose-1-phosphate thymidylyltransferase